MKGKIKLTGIWHFIMFFLLIDFVVTCNFYLFLHSMKLDAETISHSAKIGAKSNTFTEKTAGMNLMPLF